MSYSVAIRTLGTSPVFRQELESLHRQTVMPERILIYIAVHCWDRGISLGA